MSLTTEGIRQAFADWFTAASGLASNKVLLGSGDDGRGPRRSKPYAMIQMSASAIEIGQDAVWPAITESATATNAIYAYRHAVANVQVFGTGAADYIENARIGMSKQTLKDSAKESGMEIIDCSAITDLSGLLDTSYEERAAASFRLEYLNTYTELDAGSIATVTVTETLKEGDRTVTTETITASDT